MVHFYCESLERKLLKLVCLVSKIEFTVRKLRVPLLMPCRFASDGDNNRALNFCIEVTNHNIVSTFIGPLLSNYPYNSLTITALCILKTDYVGFVGYCFTVTRRLHFKYIALFICPIRIHSEQMPRNAVNINPILYPPE